MRLVSSKRCAQELIECVKNACRRGGWRTALSLSLLRDLAQPRWTRDGIWGRESPVGASAREGEPGGRLGRVTEETRQGQSRAALPANRKQRINYLLFMDIDGRPDGTLMCSCHPQSSAVANQRPASGNALECLPSGHAARRRGSYQPRGAPPLASRDAIRRPPDIGGCRANVNSTRIHYSERDSAFPSFLHPTPPTPPCS